jgi:hypothetical protein
LVSCVSWDSYDSTGVPLSPDRQSYLYSMPKLSSRQAKAWKRALEAQGLTDQGLVKSLLELVEEDDIEGFLNTSSARGRLQLLGYDPALHKDTLGPVVLGLDAAIRAGQAAIMPGGGGGGEAEVRNKSYLQR